MDYKRKCTYFCKNLYDILRYLFRLRLSSMNLKMKHIFVHHDYVHIIIPAYYVKHLYTDSSTVTFLCDKSSCFTQMSDFR